MPLRPRKLSFQRKQSDLVMRRPDCFFVIGQNIVLEMCNFSNVAPTSCVVQIAVDRFALQTLPLDRPELLYYDATVNNVQTF